MKKIGIITLPLNTNYGGIIQAYALQSVLKKMGLNPCVLDTPRYPDSRSFSIYLKRMIRKIQGVYKAPVFVERKYYQSYPVVAQYTENFIDRYICRETIDDFSALNINGFEGFVVGSDQVWRPSYFRYIKAAYLDFASQSDVKKIAYAPSLGVDFWEYSEELTAICKELLHKFDAVSVREDSAVPLFKQYMDMDVVHVLDPTMLLDIEHYIDLYMNANIPLGSYKGCLLSYILDRNIRKSEIQDYLRNYFDCEVINLDNQPENYNIDPVNRIALPVEDWFKAFHESKIVVTDSFHACVFSILFHKPFFVVLNNERGIARIASLLRLFDLEERIIDSDESLVQAIDSEIDWKKVDLILNDKRMQSFDFLNKALGCM